MTKQKTKFVLKRNLEGDALLKAYDEFYNEIQKEVFGSTKRWKQIHNGEELWMSISTINIDDMEKLNSLCRKHEMRYTIHPWWVDKAQFPMLKVYCTKQVDHETWG